MIYEEEEIPEEYQKYFEPVELGLEPTFDQYISNLCDIFDEVKRVLRDDGTCWVNLGDTYWGSGAGTQYEPKTENSKEVYTIPYNSHKNTQRNKDSNYQSKCLCMIPQRFAIEMVNRGWILRNTIIWHKPNAMPCSVKDRFTVDFEYIFFFVKSKKYYFETQYEPMLTQENRPNGIVRNREYDYDSKENNNPKAYLKQDNVPSKNSNTYSGFNKRYIPPINGRNKRAVWTITTKPFKEAHFAVYPEELCETPIKAGCPEFVCSKCGMPKIMQEKIIGHQVTESMIIAGCNKKGKYYGNEQKDYEKAKANKPSETKKRILESMSQIKEYNYKPTCKCNAEFIGGTVLDCFFGAGTTGMVALKQNKNYIGIELNPEYIKIAEARLKPLEEQRKLE